VIEVTIQDVAQLIRDMSSAQRAALADELAAASAPRVRCPARDIAGERPRCVHNEGHIGGHVAANGQEWLVALRCRLLGADQHGTLCDRLEGHDGACVRQPRGYDLPSGLAPAPPKAEGQPRQRGICTCGAPRAEHFRFIGGCGRTGCQKYQGTTRRRGR